MYCTLQNCFILFGNSFSMSCKTACASPRGNVKNAQLSCRVRESLGQNQELKGSMKEPNILIYFSFPPITQSCSVSDVLFTGGRGVSDSSALKYYYLNSVNILNEYLHILIDCSQLSKTYYILLFGSFTRDHHA